MALTVQEVRELVEIYVGEGGVNRNKIPPALINQMINLKLQEYGRRTGAVQSIATDTTVADQQEYDLGEDVVGIYQVKVDSEICYKIRYEQVAEIAGLWT